MSNSLNYCYRFKLPDGEVKEFSFRLDDETLVVAREPRDSHPDWTKLTYQQCSNCPLDESTHPQCPVASNLADMVDFFKEAVSSDMVELEIVNDERRVCKRTSMANAISALIGVVMVTSGCPVMDKLRPMVRVHLPFSTIEETLYRTLSMYLMAQYFVYKKGGKPDWDMDHLADVFEDIRVVNRSFCQRLYGTCSRDASVNAVIHLDSFVELTNFALLKKKDRLERMEKLFQPYWDDPTPRSEGLLKSIQQALRACKDRVQAVERALDLVLGWRKYFWIGVYRVDGNRARRVSFRGPLPPCHEFEFGKGNVGTAAMTGIKKVVADVSKDPVYSVCFAATRSELILPIFAGEGATKRVIGVMDVESDLEGFFTAEDERVLSSVCALLAPWLV